MLTASPFQSSSVRADSRKRSLHSPSSVLLLQSISLRLDAFLAMPIALDLQLHKHYVVERVGGEKTARKQHDQIDSQRLRRQSQRAAARE